MAAYAVIARIGRVDPHLTVRDLDADLGRDASDDVDSRRAAHMGLLDQRVVVVDRDDGPTFGDRLADQIADVREAFGQMTFYLFDPESWRR
jgi:hypothetical protein